MEVSDNNLIDLHLIEQLLKSDFENYKIAAATGISEETIQALRSGKRKIESLKLGYAGRLSNFAYQNIEVISKERQSMNYWIAKLLKSGIDDKEIVAKAGVSRTTLYAIRSGKRQIKELHFPTAKRLTKFAQKHIR